MAAAKWQPWMSKNNLRDYASTAQVKIIKDAFKISNSKTQNTYLSSFSLSRHKSSNKKFIIPNEEVMSENLFLLESL